MSGDTRAIRCTATSKARGAQCARFAIPGGNVCTYHGGKAPQVQRKAAERLAALVDPAIGALQELLSKKNKHAPTRLGAARDVLDRNGYKPTEKVEHSGEVVTQIRRVIVDGRSSD